MYEQGIPRSGAYLHNILLQTVMHATQSFFDKTDRGVTLNRFSQDMSQVDIFLPVGVVMTLQGEFHLFFPSIYAATRAQNLVVVLR